ncbi:endonuclease MutS2 [soil metagenome]
MNSHALAVLEFSRVVDLIAARTHSPLARAAVESLRPSSDPVRVGAEHSRVTAVRAFVTEPRGWAPEPLHDIRGSLARVAVVGAWLEAGELVAIAQVARSSRITRDELRHPERAAAARAVLAPFVDRLAAARDLEDAVSRAIDPDGNVLDAASPGLKAIRGELRDSENRLIRLLERVLSGIPDEYRVPDISVTIRNGRYVIPVRREGRTAVGGIVHGSSATEATLFIEPPAAVEFGNRVRELEEDERREIIRILEELTSRVRPYAAELETAVGALAELESLYARARFAIELDCAPVDFGPPRGGFSIVRGRHPLLVAQGINVVPFDLELEPGERTLLVSGPNTGGKTVLLKAVGLFTLMAQSGIPVPVAPNTRLAVFDDVFADIGDEQSIEASLSTFSGHVQNLREIVERATADSLVLIDELGSGTDPAEGAALGGAILEALTERRALTVATTHLGSLKLLASELPPVVNASLQFDSEQLGPTYELVKGRPGRSYGLSIARRLRLPEEILSRAEARLSAGERDLAALLEELEGRERALRQREREAEEILDEARGRTARLGEREQRVRDRERELQRGGRAEARQYLLDARSAVEDTIRKLRSARGEELDEVARAARRGVEERVTAASAAIAALGDSTEAAGLGESGPVVVGDWVVVDTLGGVRGRVAETRDSELVVTVGAMRMTIPSSAARWAAPGERPDTPVALRGDVPEVTARSEIDVRGMRAAEVESAVMQAVDSAVRADLKALRIIHGKGTGALRERVREMLQKEPRVVAFRVGAWNEGGAGVTVAELS